nr:hypothetical protein [Tanacetum cinerariifolium]
MINFSDLPQSDPLYGQEAQTNDIQMTTFADLPQSDPLYGQEAQKNDTQMTNFADLPKSDSLMRDDRARVAYLKYEIEALRYVDVEEQRKKWSDVYCGLEDVVAKEYDCLPEVYPEAVSLPVGFPKVVDVLMICCAHIVDIKVGLFVVPLINRKQIDDSLLSMGFDLFDRLIHGFESSATQRGNTLLFGKVGVATSGSLFVPSRI